jgi:hypothetical protein
LEECPGREFSMFMVSVSGTAVKLKKDIYSQLWIIQSFKDRVAVIKNLLK